MNKSASVVLLLILLVGSVVWLVKPQRQSESNLVKSPQEYMKNLAITHYNEQGAIKDKIYADYWAYVPEEKISNIEQPKIQINKPNKTVWFVVADRATAHQPNIGKVERIDLIRNVHLSRPKASAVEPVDVATQWVTYYPDNEFVTTDDFVTISKPGLDISGTGLNGYLDKSWLELLSNVSTTYTSS